MNRSAEHKPVRGGYPSDFSVAKDRVNDFRVIAGAAYGTPADAKALAVTGGIQPHSIGDIYPLCVVGIANGDRLHFEVHNLQTDEVMCGMNDVSAFRRQWGRAVNAYAAAAGRAMDFPTVWLPRSKANLLK